MKKNEYRIDKEHRIKVKEDIDELHYCRTQQEYDTLLEKKIRKWKRLQLNDFIDYFSKQWLDSDFSKWQIYHTPAGYSSSNGIIESYNRTVKTSFTRRQRLSVLNALKMMAEKSVYYSHRSKCINNSPKIV